MPSEQDFAEQRRRNRTAYAIEDFYSARSGLRYSAFGNLLLAAVISLALLSCTDEIVHVAAALLTGAGILAALRFANLTQVRLLYFLILVYLLGVGLEYAYAGLPAPPLPGLTVENGWVGFLPFANSLAPLLYILARGALVYPLMFLLVKRRALAAEPISTVRQLDRDLAGKMA